MSKIEVDTGLPDPGQPFSWAVRRGPLLFTNHGPVTAEGRILDAPIQEQATLTVQNLAIALEAAGGTLDDVMQVTIYLLDGADMAAVDAVYRTFFRPPYPTRASLVVAGLVAPGMRIELSAIAMLADR